jgi:hypothetical protein
MTLRLLSVGRGASRAVAARGICLIVSRTEAGQEGNGFAFSIPAAVVAFEFVESPRLRIDDLDAGARSAKESIAISDP